MNYITDLFNTHWGDKLEDRTGEVQAQNRRLKANRLKTQRRGSMTTPLRPTKASEDASKTYSEHSRRES